MRLFTTSSSIYKSDAYSDIKRNKTIRQPHACVYGTTVQKSMYEGLTADSVSDGFMSRILIFESNDLDDSEPRLVTKSPVPDEIVDVARFWGEFNPSGNLANEHPVPFVVPFVVPASDEANADFLELELWARAQRQELKSIHQSVSGLWTRTTEKARKLAMLYACSRDHEQPSLDKAAASWGSELSKYLTHKLINIAVDWVAENPYENTRKRILRTIRQAGENGLTRTELSKLTKFLKAKERNEMVASLLDTQEVRHHSVPTGGAPRNVLRAC